MLRVLAPQYSFKSTLCQAPFATSPFDGDIGCACGLPFDLMEAADGSSNKSHLLVKEPIARKAETQAVYTVTLVICSDMGYDVRPCQGDGRLQAQVLLRSPTPAFLLTSLCPSLPLPGFFLLGHTLDRCLMASKDLTFPWHSVPTKLPPLCSVLWLNSTTPLCLVPTCIMLLEET